MSQCLVSVKIIKVKNQIHELVIPLYLVKYLQCICLLVNTVRRTFKGKNKLSSIKVKSMNTIKLCQTNKCHMFEVLILKINMNSLHQRNSVNLKF